MGIGLRDSGSLGDVDFGIGWQPKETALHCEVDSRANWFLAVDGDKLWSINSDRSRVSSFFLHILCAGNITPEVSGSLSHIFMVALASIEIRSGQPQTDKNPPLGSNFWSESREMKLWLLLGGESIRWETQLSGASFAWVNRIKERAVTTLFGFSNGVARITFRRGFPLSSLPGAEGFVPKLNQKCRCLSPFPLLFFHHRALFAGYAIKSSLALWVFPFWLSGLAWARLVWSRAFAFWPKTRFCQACNVVRPPHPHSHPQSHPRPLPHNWSISKAFLNLIKVPPTLGCRRRYQAVVVVVCRLFTNHWRLSFALSPHCLPTRMGSFP